MLLHGDEVELLREHVVPFRGPHGESRGTIYLTSRRLVVEDQRTRPLRSSEVHTLLEVPLRGVTNATVGMVRGRPRYLLLEFGRDQYRADVVDPDRWVRALREAKSSEGRAPPPPPPPPPTREVHLIERQVVKVRCRHCGTLSDETLDRCRQCGAPL